MDVLIDQYTKEELQQILDNSSSYSDALRKLGYNSTSNANRRHLKRIIKEKELQVNFLPRTYNKKVTNEEIFKEDSHVSQSCLREHFLALNIVEYKCSICGQEPFWNGKPLTLTLDHINGKNRDNRLDNLRWVCPNCDRQLPTFGRKNKTELKKKKIKKFDLAKDNKQKAKSYKKSFKIYKDEKRFCLSCGKEITNNSLYCFDCANKHKRKQKERPSKEDLEKILKEENGNFSKIANQYNVSDNAVRKWCRGYGLSSKSSFYKSPEKEKQQRIEKPVRQLDLNGNLIKRYSSINQAYTETKIEHISQCAHGLRKTARGYNWEFEKD